MSQRITNVCQRRFKPNANLTPSMLNNLIASFSTPTPQSMCLLKEIAQESNLEIVNEECLLDFTREKLISYLENLKASTSGVHY